MCVICLPLEGMKGKASHTESLMRTLTKSWYDAWFKNWAALFSMVFYIISSSVKMQKWQLCIAHIRVNMLYLHPKGKTWQQPQCGHNLSSYSVYCPPLISAETQRADGPSVRGNRGKRNEGSDREVGGEGRGKIERQNYWRYKRDVRCDSKWQGGSLQHLRGSSFIRMKEESRSQESTLGLVKINCWIAGGE